MAPNVQTNDDSGNFQEVSKNQKSIPEDYTKYDNTIHTLWGNVGQPIRWAIVFQVILYHMIAGIGLVTLPIFEKKATIFWNYVLGVTSLFGGLGGVHRLWSHKSYKATLPLQILLASLYTTSGHYSIFSWAKDHRVHHKYTDTNADPFDTRRGFFFGQIGFLFMKRHPEMLRKAAAMDMSDLKANPVVMFFKKHYWPLTLLLHVAIPLGVPVYFWGETLYWSFMIATIRFIVILHIATAVNSVAHRFGSKPYEKGISGAQNAVYSFLSLGEGWHNYHHVFPWDYKTAELGDYKLNVTTMLLDGFGKIGWAYDFKTPSKELVQKYILKHGDGSHPLSGNMEVPESENVDHNPYCY